MSKTWVYSDPHFYHKNIVKFEDYDGKKIRPWATVEEMTEDMIRWYNELVNEEDRVYILGDVAFSVANMERSVSRMKGRKCLILGNHDPVKIKKYIHLFDDVRGYVQRQGFIMSHIPIHPDSLGRWKLNIHGHLHGNAISGKKLGSGFTEVDKRYFNACVENTNFKPILLDEILKRRELI